MDLLRAWCAAGADHKHGAIESAARTVFERWRVFFAFASFFAFVFFAFASLHDVRARCGVRVRIGTVRCIFWAVQWEFALAAFYIFDGKALSSFGVDIDAGGVTEGV